MAKVLLPLMSGAVKNKIGDVVFFRRGDYGINVARMRVKPQNPRTPKQTAVRHNLKTLSGIWKGSIQAGGATLYKYNGTAWVQITIASTETFGASERQAWMEYIHTTNQNYKVKGRLAFIGVNMTRLYENKNPLKTPTTEFQLQS